MSNGYAYFDEVPIYSPDQLAKLGLISGFRIVTDPRPLEFGHLVVLVAYRLHVKRRQRGFK